MFRGDDSTEGSVEMVGYGLQGGADRLAISVDNLEGTAGGLAK
jgi:hypothetical protein